MENHESSIVSVLTPNVETADDYKRIRVQLQTTALNLLDTKMEDITFSLEEFAFILNSYMVYMAFSGYAFLKGRGLFMTLDELPTSLAKIRETLEKYFQ